MIIKDSYKKTFNARDIDYLDSVLRSRKLSGTSDVPREFESALSGVFQAPFITTCTSGTSAILACLMAEEIGPGDEVLVPCYTTVPTIYPILALGATPIFIDTADPYSLSISVDDVKQKLTENTKAAITLPLWGYPINYNELLPIFSENGVVVIDDCAQAHFSQYESSYLGTLTDYGCFSLHDKKILSSGEGGFILCKDEEKHQKIKNMVNLGGGDGSAFGLNFRLGAMQASIGISRLNEVENELEIRRKNAETVLARLENTKFKELPYTGSPNYYNLVLVPKVSIDIDAAHEKLASLGLTTDYAKYGLEKFKTGILKKYYRNDLHNGVNILKNTFSIPTHPGLTDLQLQHIIQSLESI